MKTTLDEIERVFIERFAQLAPDEPDRLREALRSVRDRILVGAARASARAGIADRKRRRAVEPKRREPDPGDTIVLRRVARAAGINVDRLIADDRTRNASAWRFVAMWILHRERDLSLQEAGDVMKRDHSCVYRGVRIVDERVARDPALGAKLRRMAA